MWSKGVLIPVNHVPGKPTVAPERTTAARTRLSTQQLLYTSPYVVMPPSECPDAADPLRVCEPGPPRALGLLGVEHLIEHERRVGRLLADVGDDRAPRRVVVRERVRGRGHDVAVRGEVGEQERVHLGHGREAVAEDDDGERRARGAGAASTVAVSLRAPSAG